MIYLIFKKTRNKYNNNFDILIYGTIRYKFR